MRIEGSRELSAPPAEVFDALTDPELVAGAIPALESVDVRDRDHWTASVKFSVAPRLRVLFEVLERRPPEHARLRAHGKNLGGSATVDTSFDLTAAGDARTSMNFEAQLTLTGLLGRLGEHALRPLAQRQVERFLGAVERRVSP